MYKSTLASLISYVVYSGNIDSLKYLLMEFEYDGCLVELSESFGHDIYGDKYHKTDRIKEFLDEYKEYRRVINIDSECIKLHDKLIDGFSKHVPKKYLK